MLYLGDAAVSHAAPAVASAREAGMRVAFVTNNASRLPARVAERLTGMGVPAAPEDVVTSAQAAARLVAQAVPPGSAVLVLGTAALAEQLRDAGLRPVRRRSEAGDEAIRAVVQGLAPETSMADLAEAAIVLRSGALWVVGNTDATLPSSDGPLPGNGAFVDVLRTTTGREPEVAGKPEPALHAESVERVGASRPLVVGDRLETDVLGARRAGADSLLVLTGVTDEALLQAAEVDRRPTYVSADLRGLGVPHPEVTVQGAGSSAVARCGPASARWRDDAPSSEGGDALQALRARVALAWARADET